LFTAFLCAVFTLMICSMFVVFELFSYCTLNVITKGSGIIQNTNNSISKFNLCHFSMWQVIVH
ncbi:hypothetical protein VCHC17A1_4131B, partial [Vibrio cholerae HC-17A1]